MNALPVPATTRIRPAGQADRLAISWLLARAFDEPATRWLVPDPDRHAPVLHGFFDVLVTDALKDGAVDIVVDQGDQPVAAALWFDRTHPTHLDGATAEHDPRLDRVFGPDAGRWHTLDQLMTTAHPTQPHHYLFAIGVRPELQSRGYGSQLLTAGHDRNGQTPAYLEATTIRSRSLYRWHGYTDHGTPIQLPDGPQLWPMWRPADTR